MKINKIKNQNYQNQLKKLYVMSDFDKRRESIVSQVKKIELNKIKEEQFDWMEIKRKNGWNI